ncbi:hypothetical protein C8R47DRAFT_1025765 [Mycena vitilis]|nr:hypothetical protein C8R47DRAFT_1025765 [Mycena vitilis]
MSSFSILGFFKLKGGHRVSVQKPNSTYPTYYAQYSTNVWTLDDTAIAADLRVFLLSSASPLPDNTVVFAVCTAQSNPAPSTPKSLARNSLTLEALTFIVLPGDPNSDVYIDQLPDERTAMAFGVGRVTRSPQTLDDGHQSRVVTVNLSDYVRGETKASTIHCIFDLSTGRWTRAPVPQANSVLGFYGLCRDLDPAGVLRIKVESLAFNVVSNASVASEESTSPATTPSTKKRKWGSPPPAGPDASSSAPPSSGANLAPPAIPSTPSKTDSAPPVGGADFSPAPPAHYSQLFQQYPQYMPHGPAPPSPYGPSFVAQQPMYPGFAPHTSPFPTYAPYNARGEYIPQPPTTPSSTDKLAPSSLPRTQDDTAFNRSAANPYAYPMTQIPSGHSQSALPPSTSTPTNIQQPSSNPSTATNPQSSLTPASVVSTSSAVPESNAATSATNQSHNLRPRTQTKSN